MDLKKVSAIFDELRLRNVEIALIEHGVKGYTVCRAKGRGQYFDSFNDGHLTTHVQLDIYTNSDNAHAIAQLVLENAYSNCDNEGLVSIISVETLFWIHYQKQADPAEFNFRENKQ